MRRDRWVAYLREVHLRLHILFCLARLGLITAMVIFSAMVLVAGTELNCHAAQRPADFRSRFEQIFEPFYRSSHEQNFLGEKGVRITYRKFKQPKRSHGTVVMLTGFSENAHKYSEMIWDAYHAGYSVFIFDHRGQGFSEHLLKDPREAHIDEFDYLVADLHNFVRNVVSVETQEARYLIAHSLGGLVGVRDFERHPEDFAAAALSAPMLEVNLHGLPQTPVRLLMDLISFFDLDDFYIYGPKDPSLMDYNKNVVTHSAERFAVLNRGLMLKEPGLKIFGMSARWLTQSLNASVQAVQEAAHAFKPILLFQAGQDEFVLPEGQRQFCALATACKLVSYPEARHELLMESDEIRKPILNDIFAFFDSHRVNVSDAQK